MRTSGFFALPFTALALAAACNGSDAGPADAGTSDVGAGGISGEVSCADDERVDTYVAAFTREGERGKLSFRIDTSEPAPPAKGPNTFEVTVLDSDGEPLGGDLRIALVMPDHGHGTQVEPVVSFDDAAERFTIDPLYLFMAGVWRIELSLFDAESKLVDRAAFFFCIEG